MQFYDNNTQQNSSHGAVLDKVPFTVGVKLYYSKLDGLKLR